MMPTGRRVASAVIAAVLAGCDDSDRSARFPTAPGPVATAPAPGPLPPAPVPNPGAGPPEDQPVPDSGDGPTYVPGSGTTTMKPGESVRAVVESTDQVCFPNWDGTARCQIFEIVAPFDGRLSAQVRAEVPPSGDILDLVLNDLRRTYVVSYSGLATEEASMDVAAGSTYAVMVLAYRTPLQFELRVDVARP